MQVIKEANSDVVFVDFDKVAEIKALTSVFKSAGSEVSNFKGHVDLWPSRARVSLYRPADAISLIAILRLGLGRHESGVMEHEGEMYSLHQWFGWLFDDLKRCLDECRPVGGSHANN